MILNVCLVIVVAAAARHMSRGKVYETHTADCSYDSDGL